VFVDRKNYRLQDIQLSKTRPKELSLRPLPIVLTAISFEPRRELPRH
jgi:hypothetical protein